jgi:hypothetical protein
MKNPTIKTSSKIHTPAIGARTSKKIGCFQADHASVYRYEVLKHHRYCYLLKYTLQHRSTLVKTYYTPTLQIFLEKSYISQNYHKTDRRNTGEIIYTPTLQIFQKKRTYISQNYHKTDRRNIRLVINEWWMGTSKK